MRELLTLILTAPINDETARQAVVDGIISNPEQADDLLKPHVADDAQRADLLKLVNEALATGKDARRIAGSLIGETLRGRFDSENGEFIEDPLLRAAGLGATLDTRFNDFAAGGWRDGESEGMRVAVDPLIRAAGLDQRLTDRLAAFELGDDGNGNQNPIVRATGFRKLVDAWSKNGGDEVARESRVAQMIEQARGDWKVPLALVALLLLGIGLWAFTSLSGDVNNAKTEIATLKSETGDLDGRMTGVEGGVYANEQAIAANADAIQDNSDRLNAEVAARQKGDRKARSYARAQQGRFFFRRCVASGKTPDACRGEMAKSGYKVSKRTAKRWSKGLKKASVKKAPKKKTPGAVSQRAAGNPNGRLAANQGPVGFSGRDLQRLTP